MKDIYITIYTKEKGKLEFTEEEWSNFDISAITYHRVDGPAIIRSNGDQFYYINGKRHRLDGPAVIFSNGDQEYWVDHKYYSKEEFNKIINEVRKLSKTEKLIDERWWVREL